MVRYDILRALITGAVLGIAAFTGTSAKAVPIFAGNSNSSTFSGCTYCLSGTTGTHLVLPTGTGDKTTLTIDPISFSASGSTTGLMLAELLLDNGNKPSVGPFSFNYNLALTFTTPVGSDLRTFALSITGNNKPGSHALNQLSGFSSSLLPTSLILDDVTLSNFRFATNGGNFDPATGQWSLSGNHVDTLDLLADLTYAPPPEPTSLPDSTPVQAPEPTSLALLGAGLLALLAVYRRDKSRIAC